MALPQVAPEHRGVHVFSEYTADLRLDCDVVVVGTGPGGGVVTKALAEAGLDVIALEEGPPFATADFVPEAGEAMQRMFREAGLRASRGNLFMPMMQAIGLGGGSLVNSAICCRAPDWVFEKWAKKTGLKSTSGDTMRSYYDRVEEFWGVEETPEAVMGERNLSFKRGCAALGMSSEPIRRNVRGCKGSGQCFTGCPNHAKISIDLSYLPTAISAGARIYASIRAERVLAEGRRVSGISGHTIEPFTWQPQRQVDIKAKYVVLAAGCMATPVILEKSGLANSSGWVGRGLQTHPGLAVMALFDHAINPWFGATQGYHSLDYLKEGMKFEVLWAPPAVLAARLPGIGMSFKEALGLYERMAPYDVFVAADDSTGEVRAKRNSFDPDIHYNLAATDVERLRRGMGILADISFAAGAIEILPGLHNIPERLRSRAEAEILRTQKLAANETITASNHLFGTTRMASDPKQGVVDENGRCHDLDNLYIADTGVFPASPAVNPMLTCMALAERTAEAVTRAG